MSTNDLIFQPKDRNLSKPGFIGRIGRMIFGLFSLWFVREAGTHYWYFVSEPTFSQSINYLVGVGIAFWVMPEVVNLCFNRQWGNGSQKIFLGLATLALAADFIYWGSWWGPPLGWVIWGMAVFTHSYLGISHVLAAIIGTPGCEMRAIPHLWAYFNKQNVELVVCPGHWDAVDRWESTPKG